MKMRIPFKKGMVCGVSLLMLAAPCIVKPSLAEVVIDDSRTAGIVLENETNTAANQTNATVKSGASVTAETGKYAILGKTGGWNITVEKGATVARTGTYANGIWLNPDGDSTKADLNGNVTNRGTIQATGSAIQLGAGTVVNEKEAVISSKNNYGVQTTGGPSTVINEGSIVGRVSGVSMDGSSANTLINKETGTIGDFDTSSYGVRIAGTVENEGLIVGNSAVYMFSEDSRLTNKKGGTIIGKTNGILGIGSIVNEEGATIKGSTMGVDTIGDSSVSNAGTIEGATGIRFRGSEGDNILDNRGTIIGTSGNAVLMGADNDTAYLRNGSDITGNVDADNSADSSIVSGTDDTVYLTGSGEIKNGTLLNFETIEKSGDGTWSLGGDLSSGNSISVLGGVLKASGVYTHEAGATYTVGAGSNGKAGKITADTATLNGGAVSVVSKGLKGGTHTIVETTNGLTGTFDSVTSDSKYREMSLAYDAKNSYLNMKSNFKKAGATGTRGNVASAIDDAYGNSSSDDMVTVVDELFSLDDGALNSAIDQISGTTHSVSATVAPVKQGSFYQNLFGRTGGATTGLGFLGLNDRQSDPLTMLASGGPVANDAGFSLTRAGQKLPYGMWIKGYSVMGNRHGGDTGSRYDYTIGGAIAGFDYLINPNIRAGVAVGYSKTSVDMKQLQDNSDVESFQGALYGSYVPTSKLWYVDAAFAYSKNSYETKRYLTFGNIYRVARGSYDGSDISGYLEGGYKVPIFGGITATPLVSFLAMRNHTDSFTETGAGSVNLETGSNNTDSYQSGLGVKLSREFKAAKDFTFTPEFGAKWLHEFGDTEANINARFAGETAGSFVIASDTTERDTGVFSLNLTGKKGDMLNFFVGYDLGITNDQISHGFTGGLRLNW
ncbi:MAG: autotransporter domain-containing protein [Syntrophorhabdaceae bacterium]|nr:autotransporter domain-containing protein [Syntrophorhabdaceae bacterium]